MSIRALAVTGAAFKEAALRALLAAPSLVSSPQPTELRIATKGDEKKSDAAATSSSLRLDDVTARFAILLRSFEQEPSSTIRPYRNAVGVQYIESVRLFCGRSRRRVALVCVLSAAALLSSLC